MWVCSEWLEAGFEAGLGMVHCWVSGDRIVRVGSGLVQGCFVAVRNSFALACV